MIFNSQIAGASLWDRSCTRSPVPLPSSWKCLLKAYLWLGSWPTHTHTHNHILDAVNKVCKVVGGGRWVEKVGGCSDPADLKNKLVALTQQD